MCGIYFGNPNGELFLGCRPVGRVWHLLKYLAPFEVPGTFNFHLNPLDRVLELRDGE